MASVARAAAVAGVLLAPAAPDAATVPELAAAVRAAVAGPAEGRIERAAAALERFLAEPELDPAVGRPHPGLGVTTYLLHVEPDGAFSIAALVIRPGATTPIHDHGTWTVWGTLRGRDRETRYAREGDGPASRVVAVAERLLPDAGVSRIPRPPDDLHRVGNAGDVPSVSIHVHGADMSRQVRHAYDPASGRVSSFVQSYVEAAGGVP